MSNTYKIIIATIVVAILAGTAAIFLNSQSRNSNNPNTSSASSSVQAVSSSITSSSKSVVVSSSSQSQSEIAKVVESSKAESAVKVEQSKMESSPPIPQPIDRGSNPNPIQDVPNVTKLSTDKSIYWQYINDYLACPTKFYQPLNGGYTYEGLNGEYKYLCIPQEEADKCPSKTLIYGLKPIVGKRVGIIDGTGYPPGIPKIIELNKYYCAHFFESTGSVSLSEISSYGLGYFPAGIDPKLPGYYTIPKSNFSTKDQFNNFNISFAAIPLESFSKEDQQYIAKNLNLK